MTCEILKCQNPLRSIDGNHLNYEIPRLKHYLYCYQLQTELS